MAQSPLPLTASAQDVLSAGYEARTHILAAQSRLRRHDARLVRPSLTHELAERLHSLEELSVALKEPTDTPDLLALHELKVRARAEVEMLREIQHGCEELLSQCGILADAPSTDAGTGADACYPVELRTRREAHSR